MTRLRKIVLTGTLALFAALPFVGHIASIPAVNAEAGESAQGDKAAKPTKVSYIPISAGDYKLDPAHSVIGFTIRHNELKLVSGRFKDFTGTIHLDDKDVT